MKKIMTASDVVVKWTGSKRLQGPAILSRFPEEMDVYFEPFIGGGSMLFHLMNSGKRFKRCECSDINEALIGIWKLIKSDPAYLMNNYSDRWNKLKAIGKQYYYDVRAEYNQDHSPEKFFFLLRTCRNGLVRYNLKGQFTTAFHLKQNAMAPDTLDRTMANWNRLLNEHDVSFFLRDYRNIQASESDYLYLDPPYALPKHRKVVMYYGMFDFPAFWEWLERQPCHYSVSLNGFKGDIDYTLDFPKHLYNEHILLSNGLNKFDQMCNKRVAAKDSLYIKV